MPLLKDAPYLPKSAEGAMVWRNLCVVAACRRYVPRKRHKKDQFQHARHGVEYRQSVSNEGTKQVRKGQGCVAVRALMSIIVLTARYGRVVLVMVVFGRGSRLHILQVGDLGLDCRSSACTPAASFNERVLGHSQFRETCGVAEEMCQCFYR